MTKPNIYKLPTFQNATPNILSHFEFLSNIKSFKLNSFEHVAGLIFFLSKTKEFITLLLNNFD